MDISRGWAIAVVHTQMFCLIQAKPHDPVPSYIQRDQTSLRWHTAVTSCPLLNSSVTCLLIFAFSSGVASMEFMVSSPNSRLRVTVTCSPASTMPWLVTQSHMLLVRGYITLPCMGQCSMANHIWQDCLVQGLACTINMYSPAFHSGLGLVQEISCGHLCIEENIPGCKKPHIQCHDQIPLRGQSEIQKFKNSHYNFKQVCYPI